MSCSYRSFLFHCMYTCVMFFTITFDSVFFLHVCAMHLCLFQLHMSCIFCFFTCLCNVSYYHSSCECRLFAKFLQNKLPYWHWCYWGDLVKKRREKLNQSSLLNKNMYQSSVIHLHHIFFIYIFQGLSNSKCAMKCRLYKDRDLRCARIA